MDISPKPKLSKEEYIEGGGVMCPYCAKDGGIESNHSLDCQGGNLHLDVVCTFCGEYLTEIYSFFSWKSEEDQSNDMEKYVCPNCEFNFSDECVEDIQVDGAAGILLGEIVCPECDNELKVSFQLRDWVPR